MPVDISFVFAEERPAGKHGFLRADDDVFRFENGTKARVWGVNFNGGTNFPEHDYAEGFYVGRIPAVFEDGKMTFRVGDKWPTSI